MIIPSKRFLALSSAGSVIFVLALLVSDRDGRPFELSAAPPDKEASKEPETPLADAKRFEQTVKPFFQAHCITCHNQEKASGQLRLDNIETDFISPGSSGKWIEVMDKLNLGEMPPEGEPRAEIEKLTAVTRWIAAELRHAERQRKSTGGRVVLRRMNRAEYANTIRDLLKIEFLPGESPLELLPPDGTAEGFDKVSLALTLDPSLLEQYFDVAQRIADKALVDGPPEFPTEVMRYELEDTAKNRAIDYLCAKPGMICRDEDMVLMQGSTRSFGVMKYPGTNNEIPVKGMYRVRVRAWGERGADGEPVVMRFQQKHPEEDQQLFLETEVTDKPKIYEVIVPRDPKCGEYNVSIVNGHNFQTYNRIAGDVRKEQRKAGEAKDFERVMRLQSRQQMEALTKGRPNPETADLSKLRKLMVDWIECEGPLYDQWPPMSHQLVLFRGREAEQNADYIKAIFERLMKRAFRRPVTDEEVAPVVGLVQDELKAGETFNDAIRSGLVAVLCSPKFLYIAEPAETDPNSPRPLDDWEIASRLSYFLWSSMPDEKLFELAEVGRLRDPEVLTTQVDRMLADGKAEGFVKGFGGQWLRTEEFRAFTPDARLYKNYDEELGEAMVGEALAFFEKVLRKDEPVESFIDADWTMVNERLAEFYGIQRIEGDEFRRVTLPEDSPRGGILGMAGVAMAGSDGNRTKPVHRGVYVREVLFNDPPDPPPPNVGEVEPNIRGKNLTVRERLIQHQQIASCAACHKRIDCYGLALENFNAIGAWRTKQDGEDFRPNKAPPIDPSGTLPNGEAFETFAEFQSLMLSQKERFHRGLAEKLLIYALGRPVEPSDRGLVDRLTKQLAEKPTLRRLIQGIVTSRTFLSK